MGKVILEFDSVEEQEEIQDAINGYKWKLVVEDFDKELRKTTKYGTSFIGNEHACSVEDAVAEKYREKIREILSEYKLKLD